MIGISSRTGLMFKIRRQYDTGGWGVISIAVCKNHKPKKKSTGDNVGGNSEVLRKIEK